MLHQKVVNKCFGHQVVVSFLIFQIYPRLIGGLFQAILQHFQCHLAKLVQPYRSEVFPGTRLPNNKREDVWRGGPKKTYHPFHRSPDRSRYVWKTGDPSHSKMERLRLRNVGCFSRFWTLPFRQKEPLPMEGHGAPINSLIYKWVCLELFHPL